LPTPGKFDTVGDPATLSQRWKRWEDSFELFVAASGVVDATQKRALLLHLAGNGVKEILDNLPKAETGESKDYDKARKSLADFFKQKKNVPMARQVFLATAPAPGETINNYITRLQTLVEDCDYPAQDSGNQIRDRVLFHISNKALKSKLYREENLTLTKLCDMISTYHEKVALILVPFEAKYVSKQKKKMVLV